MGIATPAFTGLAFIGCPFGSQYTRNIAKHTLHSVDNVWETVTVQPDPVSTVPIFYQFIQFFVQTLFKSMVTHVVRGTCGKSLSLLDQE